MILQSDFSTKFIPIQVTAGLNLLPIKQVDCIQLTQVMESFRLLFPKAVTDIGRINLLSEFQRKNKKEVMMRSYCMQFTSMN